jgi:UDP-N-acetyl-D-glucosamine dehydrogenase
MSSISAIERFPRVAVIGQGYAGLPVAIRAAEVGFASVVGFEVDATRAQLLNAGTSFIEDVSSEALQACLASGRYRASTDPGHLAGFDVAVVSVPTPLRDGAPDLRHIEAAARTLAPRLRRGACVILESTTYPGTTEELVAPLLEEGSGLKAGPDFHLGYSPERIDPGNATYTFVNTPKVVSGIDDESLEVVAAFYGALVDTLVPVATTRGAELSKLLENTFRHVNIALVNELAMFAHDLGIDIHEAIDAASTKPFGFQRFTPGPGVGGHCLPIDPKYLSWQVERALGQKFRFVQLASDVNDHMPDYVVRRVATGLNERGLAVNGRRIAVVGFAYKRNTSDARETPARAVVAQLLSLGAEVCVVDPHVPEHLMPPGVDRIAGTAKELADVDAAILLVDHDDTDVDALMRAPYVFDCCRGLTGPNVERL